jgi:hypothetical protein
MVLFMARLVVGPHQRWLQTLKREFEKNSRKPRTYVKTIRWFSEYSGVEPGPHEVVATGTQKLS